MDNVGGGKLHIDLFLNSNGRNILIPVLRDDEVSHSQFWDCANVKKPQDLIIKYSDPVQAY